MDPELRAAFDGINARFDGIDKRFDGIDKRFDGIDKRLDGIDKRLDGIDKRLDGVEKVARTALEETRNLGQVVSGLLTDNKVYANGLSTLLGMVSDNARTLGELNDRVGRLVQTATEARTADAERWKSYDQRLVKLEHAVSELQEHPR